MIYVNCVVNPFSWLMPFFITKKKMGSTAYHLQIGVNGRLKNLGGGGGSHGDSNDLPASQKHNSIKLVLMTHSGLNSKYSTFTFQHLGGYGNLT